MMFSAKSNLNVDFVDETEVAKLIKKWKEEKSLQEFNETEHLISLCECLRHVQSQFWGGNPYNFDESESREIPVGVFADICNDIASSSDFIYDLIVKHIITRSVPDEITMHMLKLLCLVLNCCSISTIFSDRDTNNIFYERILDLLMLEDYSYCTYILCQIMKDQKQLFVLLAMIMEIKKKMSYGTYMSLMKMALDIMKNCLEKSLLCWSSRVGISHATDIQDFPIDNEIPVSKKLAKAIPLAMKLQTWEPPYISDQINIIKIIYSSTGFFKDSLSNFNKLITSSLDILSFLCLSNKFVCNFLDFKESDTKTTVNLIFGNIIWEPDSSNTNHVLALKSILFFLSVLYCRPIQGILTPVNLNKFSRKRRGEDIDSSEIELEKVPISNERIETEITTSAAQGQDCFAKPRNTNKELQTELWSFLEEYSAVSKLVEVMEESVGSLHEVSVRTWIYHVMSGLTRCNEVLICLKKLPMFNRAVIFKFMGGPIYGGLKLKLGLDDQMQFNRIADRLLYNLYGFIVRSSTESDSDIASDYFNK